MPELTALDRLLPDAVIDQYVPSLAFDTGVADSGLGASFPTLEQVRPRECKPLIELFTDPIENPSGVIMEWGWNEAYQGDYAMSTTQRLFVFQDPQVAEATFTAASEVLEQCDDASGGWPQTGSFRSGDGLEYKRFSTGIVEQRGDRAYLLADRPIIDDRLPALSGFAVQDNIVVSVEMRPPAEMTASRAVDVLSEFLADSIGYAIQGEEYLDSKEPLESSGASQALDCLSAVSTLTEVINPYSSALGPGYGSDIFVAVPVTVENECGKAVKSFEYVQLFSLPNRSDFFRGSGSVELAVPAGETRTTESNFGYTVYSFDRNFSTFADIEADEVTLQTTISQIIFEDGTSLP